MILGRLICGLPGALGINPRLIQSVPVLWGPSPAFFHVAVNNYAARKGTRERKRKIALANKAAKKNKEPVVPPHIKKLMEAKLKNLQNTPLFKDESLLTKSEDNVYIRNNHKMEIYDVKTAINFLCETHHPTMFNNPLALINAYFELDLTTKKKTQFVGNVNGVAELPYYFESGRPAKTVCVFCKEKDLNQKALEAGALAAVGLEGIKMFQDGALNAEDYDVIVAHPDILPELAPIRGLISKKFPNIKKGTVAFDVASLVKRFRSGVEYNMGVNPAVPELGIVYIPIGLAQMSPEHMVKNYKSAVDAVLSHKPPGVPNKFITVAGVSSQYTAERFKVDISEFLDAKKELEAEVTTKEAKAASA
ncbi:50S ribosomal protein L1 [Frankliniella fusca]|uniref:50S ribosomal protein L1 n=1 Tax=Frankliniella fusca TaxID=407009 RepID=A0AAE1LUC4_9NEOP|nr:50S ribosomal protein L1 [Frankliniella fusca]